MVMSRCSIVMTYWRRLAEGSFLKHVAFRQPSNDRGWALDVAVFPEIVFENDGTIHIRHIRNFTYQSISEYVPDYFERVIRVSQIKTVWFAVEPFSLIAAHTFLSFGLDDGTYITISVEIRKQVGQVFSQLMVLFFLRRHELIYVIGDERDIIKLRTNYRKDDVYLYPIQIAEKEAQALFVDMLKRAKHLQQYPEFYHPITNTCLTNLVVHANTIKPKRIPWRYQIWIAIHADRLAYAIGLLDRSLPFRQLKQKCHINQQALQYADDPDFSLKIRQNREA